ncbi:putative DNA-binding protein YwzG [Marivirga tractuosa]|uniref:Transcriptional regulator, PadR family n=2 Tax=Marivirga TaxID=869806 RepID=E4TRD4_MARTH|nr:transcriptional regulator, PadR family [Marivirga tractuosa DSM 4126]BDD14882.1 putative DNA-binding protein YwzG [Marivirga tractuosa]
MHKKILYTCIMANQQLIKGSLTTIVLHLLQTTGEMYGYEITQKVKQLTSDEIKLTEGALYPTLHKLEAEGTLTTESRKVDGRIRKYYRLTEDGKKATAEKMQELEAFLLNMQRVLGLNLKLR